MPEFVSIKNPILIRSADLIRLKKIVLYIMCRIMFQVAFKKQTNKQIKTNQKNKRDHSKNIFPVP